MRTKIILSVCAAALLMTGCRDDSDKPKQEQPVAEKPTAKTGKSGPKLYFICNITYDGLQYFSEMVEGPSGATNDSMAASFVKKFNSLDRTYFPIPEGQATNASCKSSADARAMAFAALDARDAAMASGSAFRTVTGWKP